MFHYLFTITNAFQGVWISLLHFYERRKDVYLLIKEVTKKLSNFLGSTRQARSETPTESTSSFVALSGHTSATESEA